MALDLARLGLGRTSPNPAVGCVVVKNGKVLSTGFHRQAGLPHAEIEALTPLRPKESRGATLYVNLEPCSHFGRTPPCLDTILHLGIKRVVVGVRDPDPKVSGKALKTLRQSGIEVVAGILEEESRQLNEAYFTHRTTGRPFIFLKIATTIEGKIGWSGRGTIRSELQVTGPMAQRVAHQYRDQVDAIVVGIGTVLADDPCLTTRISGVATRDPARFILDSSLRIPLNSKLLHLSSRSKTTVVTATREDKRQDKKINAIRSLGHEVIFCPKDRRGRIHLRQFLERLAGEGIMTLLVEGGANVWDSFIEQGLVNRLLVFLGTGRKIDRAKQRPLVAPLELLTRPFQKIEIRPTGEDFLFIGDFPPHFRR
jgi:diaminohydroxyphosphoribosylaminopyrimidine deaminase/5-amino-6-(5-phosphoribosylamino)uracil reductase